jgi:hypothetical protein
MNIISYDGNALLFDCMSRIAAFREQLGFPEY